MRSKTKYCKDWVLNLPLTRYKLVKESPTGYEEIDLPVEEREMMAKLHRTREGRQTRVVPIHPNGPKRRFRIIDTPGLDDSDGDDFKNMAEVVRFLHKMTEEAKEEEKARQEMIQALGDEAKNHRELLPKWKSIKPGSAYINCLIFIANSTESFSNSFQTLYRTYEKTMPNLFGGLAVVNTKFTVGEWKSQVGAVKRILGAFHEPLWVRKRRDRVNDFVTYCNRVPNMFYIDSSPHYEEPFEVFASLTNLSEILGHVVSQQPMPVDQMRIYKTATMAAVDSTMATLLEAARDRLRAIEQNLIKDAGDLKKQRQYVEEKLNTNLKLLERHKAQLEQYNNDTEFSINTHYTTEKHGWWSTTGRKAVFYKTTGSKTIKEPNHPGFLVRQINDAEARWTSSKMNGDEWIGEYEGNRGLIPHLAAKTYTTNRQFYAKEIRELDNTIYELETDIKVDKQQAAYLKSKDLEDDDPEVKKIGQLIAQCADVRAGLMQENVDIATGFDDAALNAAIRRYRKKPENVEVIDLMDYIRPMYPLLASMVGTVLLTG